jgi:dienelactone hydrolase
MALHYPRFCLLLTVFMLLSACTGKQHNNPSLEYLYSGEYPGDYLADYSFEVSQLRGMINLPLTIRFLGLSTGQVVTIKATTLDGHENLWWSQATFKANSKGVVDLTEMVPINGTYNKLSAMGLFWSMSTNSDTDYFYLDNHTVKLSAYADGKILAEVNIDRLSPLEVPEVIKQEIRSDKLIANFYYPAKAGSYPGIIYLGGSGGDFASVDSAYLASQGFAVLNVRYFGSNFLPEDLVGVPIEYFEVAINWLKENKLTKNMPMAIMGHSRGAEAAILAAAHYPVFDAVIVTSPSAVIWPAPGIIGYYRSAWSINNKDIQPLDVGLYDGAKWLWQVVMGKQGIVSRAMFVNALSNTQAISSVILPVEKIGAPILFISGKQDLMWPATKMANMLMTTLETEAFPYSYQHFAFDNAGHNFGLPFIPLSIQERHTFLSGGSRQGNAFAGIEADQKMLNFLQVHLKKEK